MKATILCATMTGMLLTSGPAFAAGFVQGPFTRNASTRIVVDDNMQYIADDIKSGGWTKYWTNVDLVRRRNRSDLRGVVQRDVAWRASVAR